MHYSCSEIPNVIEGGSPTPGSPSKFLMAAFVRTFAQKMTAEICPVQPFVMHWTPK
jgi:hypothetical protein